MPFERNTMELFTNPSLRNISSKKIINISYISNILILQTSMCHLLVGSLKTKEFHGKKDIQFYNSFHTGRSSDCKTKTKVMHKWSNSVLLTNNAQMMKRKSDVIRFMQMLFNTRMRCQVLGIRYWLKLQFLSITCWI